MGCLQPNGCVFRAGGVNHTDLAVDQHPSPGPAYVYGAVCSGTVVELSLEADALRGRFAENFSFLHQGAGPAGVCR